LLEVLRDVDAEMAATTTPAARHSIWLMVQHMRTWQDLGFEALHGKALPPAENNEAIGWQPILVVSEANWQRELARLRDSGEKLSQKAASMEDRRLNEQVPGRAYDFGHLLLGIASHNAYHCGQIVLVDRYLHLHQRTEVDPH
jgi:hypothetical protein